MATGLALPLCGLSSATWGLDVIPALYRNLASRGTYGDASKLVPTKGFMTTRHGEIFYGLDIFVDKLNPLRLLHKVALMHCRIRWRDGPGLVVWPGAEGSIIFGIDMAHASPPGDLSDFPFPPPFESIEDMLASHLPPPVGVGGFSYPLDADPIPDTAMQPGIAIFNTSNIRVHGVRIQDPSVGILVQNSSGCRLSRFSVHRPRGPFYRGQGLQFVDSHNNLAEDFFIEAPLDNSFVEDSVSVYYSSNNTIRRGLIIGNNAPLGVGIMAETSSFNLFEDIDCIDMGNGAFSSYGYWELSPTPPPPTGPGHSNTYRRCRARDSHWESPRGSRPASGVMFHAVGGTSKIRYENCTWWNPHPNAVPSEGEPDAIMPIPGVLIQDIGAVDLAQFTQQDFTPRTFDPIVFPWEDWTGGPFMAALNIQPGEGTPHIPETISEDTHVGTLRAESAEPTETFSFGNFITPFTRFDIYDGDKVKTGLPRYSWDDNAIEYIPLETIGSRGPLIERLVPIIVDPIDEVGVGCFAGAVAGVLDSTGKLPNGWNYTRDPGVTIRVMEVGYTHPLHYIKLRMTVSATYTGVRTATIHFPDGFGMTGPAEDGDTYRIRAYVAKDETEPYQLHSAGIILYELDDALEVLDQHTIANEGLWFASPDALPPYRHPLLNPLAKFTNDFELEAGGTTRVSGALYLGMGIEPGDSAKTQTIYLAAPRVWPISGANQLTDPTIFNGLRAGAAVGVLGSGGSLPTGWTHDAADNVTLQVMSVTTVDGVQCFDLLISASTAPGTGNVSIFFPAGWGGSAAAQGETWRAEACLKIVSQSKDGALTDNQLSIYELNGSYVDIGIHSKQFPLPWGNTNYRTGYRHRQVTLPNAAAAFVNGALYFAIDTSTGAASARIRIAAKLSKVS